MRQSYKCSFVLALFILLISSSMQAFASEVISESTAHSISDCIVPFIAAGSLSMVSDKHELVICAKAIGCTCAATELLKHFVAEKRPNSDSRSSFPSGHTSAAFAMATVLTDYKPAYKWPAYITASAIGYSRVEAGAHYWRDVVGGAALGYFVAKKFTNNHVIVTPASIGYSWKW